MKHVTILMLEQGFLSTVTGPMEVFQQAGIAWNYLTGQTLRQQFQVATASVDGKPVTGAGGLVITPKFSIKQIKETDLILVTSADMSRPDQIPQRYAPVIRWLKRRHALGTTIAGVCSGVCLLAEAGLLNGKEATTHWGFAEQFQLRYPQIKLRPDQLITDEGSVVCGGGVNAALDLSLYLVEKYCGHETAMQCAKSLLIETSRASQAGFAALAFNKRHADKIIIDAQNWIEKNYVRDFSFDALAAQLHMSSRNFMRRFKVATDDTPLAYLQRVRIGAAKTALEQGGKSIETVSNEVGYADVAFFRTLFRRHVGINPKIYKEKFGRP